MPASRIIGIVDDDVNIPKSLSSLVRSLGYKAECFDSAQALLCRGDLRDLFCIITDIQMPVMDGFQLTRQIIAQGDSPPVILMTGNALPGIEDKAAESGAISLVMKPFRFTELEASLDKAAQLQGSSG